MFLNKELQRRIVSVCFIFFAAFMLSGCMGGGGGGGGSSSSVGGVDTISLDSGIPDLGSGRGDGLSADSGSTVVAVHHPEPSSIILLGSGLLGMLIAKRKKR